MSRKVSPTADARKGGRRKTLLWIAALSVLVILLLYFEQTALLYVLSTLGVVALLVIVAVADLSGARKDMPAAAIPADDAAALGTGIASAMQGGTVSAAPRVRKRK